MMTLLSGIFSLTLLATPVSVNDVAVSNESLQSVSADKTSQSENRDSFTLSVNETDNMEVEQLLSSPQNPFPKFETKEIKARQCVNVSNEKDPRVISLLESKIALREENYKKLQREEAKKNDKTGFDLIYQEAGARYNIPWEVLSAIHLVETGRRGDTGIASYAGASGPMQFMPATFRSYGVDGDGDGRAVISDSDDAIHSAANYLLANGGDRNIRGALYRYNHSTAYVNKVVGIARQIGYHG